MYRVEVAGIADGSEWDIWPSGFATEAEAVQFMVGIGRTILAIGAPAPLHLTVSMTHQAKPILTWPIEALRAVGYLLPVEEGENTNWPT